jgi:hypothetical protein
LLIAVGALDALRHGAAGPDLLAGDHLVEAHYLTAPARTLV